MIQVKVTFKKVPQLGKLVLVPQGNLTDNEACESCEIYHKNNPKRVDCHVIDGGQSCIDKHWQKAKP